MGLAYIVCNVTTQKYKVLPKPSGLSTRRPLHRSAHLAFDPLKSPHYKVVVGSHFNRSVSEPWSFEIDIYDSEGGNWEKIIPRVSCWGRGVFRNGAIHWLNRSDRNVLLRFSVDAKELVTLSRPSYVSKSSIKYFGECGGSWVFVQASSAAATVFKIIERGSAYCVNRRTIARAFPELEEFFEFYVLCVVKGNKKGDHTVVLSIPGRVISYNLKCDSLDVLLDLEPGQLIDDDVNGCAYPFLETLFPL